MLHDSLLEIDRLDQFERVYGRAVAAGHAGVVASFAVGGLLAGAKGFGLPLALSVAGPWLGAVVVAKAMSDPPRCSFGPAVPRRYLDTVRAGLAEVRSSSVLLHVVGIGATVACVWGAAEELVPVYLAEKERFTLAFDRSYPGVYVGRECRRNGLRSSASGAFRGCDLSSFCPGQRSVACLCGSRWGTGLWLAGRLGRHQRFRCGSAGRAPPAIDSRTGTSDRHFGPEHGSGSRRDSSVLVSRIDSLSHELACRYRRGVRGGRCPLRRVPDYPGQTRNQVVVKGQAPAGCRAARRRRHPPARNGGGVASSPSHRSGALRRSRSTPPRLAPRPHVCSAANCASAERASWWETVPPSACWSARSETGQRSRSRSSTCSARCCRADPVAMPFNFRQRPEPCGLRILMISLIRPPTAIVSILSTVPRSSKCTANHSVRKMVCHGSTRVSGRQDAASAMNPNDLFTYARVGGRRCATARAGC